MLDSSPAEQFKMVFSDSEGSDGESNTWDGTSNLWGRKVNTWDYRRERKMCDDFMEHPLVKAAGLVKEEVVAARLYTG